ncbi:MAG: adenylyl-sulfate kinase, partial [Pirellulaceae bacterium]
MMSDEVRVTWHAHSVSQSQRERLHGHRGCVVWFTGLSGCGKSTVANVLDHTLHQAGIHSFVLDGDNIRHGLNASPAILAKNHSESYSKRFGLGFSAEDREENIRRIGAVAELFASAGIVTLTAFVSPYRRDRDAVRRCVESNGTPGDFIEVLVDAPLDLCEQRDPKGLYKKARAGELTGFTGIDDPYEPPANPELRLDSARYKADALAEQVIA